MRSAIKISKLILYYSQLALSLQKKMFVFD